MKKFNLVVPILVVAFGLTTCTSHLGEAVVSTPISRIEQMPNMPEPYLIIDWDKKAMAFDSLAYNFNNLFQERFRLRLYLTSQNLITLTKYSGLDPEVFSGIDNNIYPRPRTFLLGVSLTY